MVGALVVTHGNLSVELVGAAKKIVGEADRLVAVSIDWDDDVSAAHSAIAAALKKVDSGEGALIMTDMFGGTPTNLSLSFLEPGRIEIVTGVNLPMLVKFLNLPGGAAIPSVVSEIRKKGQRSIQVASDLLARGAQRKSR